jgi:hypothetical protein
MYVCMHACVGVCKYLCVCCTKFLYSPETFGYILVYSFKEWKFIRRIRVPEKRLISIHSVEMRYNIYFAVWVGHVLSRGLLGSDVV